MQRRTRPLWIGKPTNKRGGGRGKREGWRTLCALGFTLPPYPFPLLKGFNMTFIPHTEQDIQSMLSSIGAKNTDALFDEIPAALKSGKLSAIGDGLNEMQVTRLMHARAAQDGQPLNFIGAGAYEHHIPAAVWEIATRGEFYTAYTPYHAEASQGTLQVLYEYQTMIASLTGMDASNASLYDGASGLAEAILMAVRAHKTSRRVLLPATASPLYRSVAHSIVKLQNIELVEIPFDTATGTVDLKALEQHAGTDIAALVIPQPNFFGALEDVDALTDWAHAQNALAIALVNPLTLALLKAPGNWGSPLPNPLPLAGEGWGEGCPNCPALSARPVSADSPVRWPAYFAHAPNRSARRHLPARQKNSAAE